MKTLNALRLCCAVGLFFLGVAASAQTTWNFVISSAGGADSLDSIVTWSVTGDLATPPGQTVTLLNQSGVVISVMAPGIYASSFSDLATLPIPDPDGSAFQYYPASVYAPINQYEVNTGPGFGNQTFGLVAPLLPNSQGMNLLYVPGTQSVMLRIPFSDFNPGTYQSAGIVLSSFTTVNLMVVPVPEPASWALAASAVFSTIVMLRGRSGQLLRNCHNHENL